MYIKVLIICSIFQKEKPEKHMTQSILHCVRRLIADKGNVKQIISDPGTNLKGAAAELNDVWTNLYFPTLLRRQKWHHLERNLCIGDVCIVKDRNALRGEWKHARVSDVFL